MPENSSGGAENAPEKEALRTPPPAEAEQEVKAERIASSAVFKPARKKDVAHNASPILLEFAAPFLEIFDEAPAYKQALAFSILIWNISGLPKAERDRQLDRIIQNTPEFEWDELMATLVGELILRKQDHFSQYPFRISDFEIEDTEEGIRLSVTALAEEN